MMQTIQCLDLLIAAMQIANFWNASSFRPFPFPTSGAIHSLRIVLCLGLWYLFVDWFFHWIVQLGMKRWVDADRWCQPILESWMDHSCEKLPLSSYFVLTLLELWLASRAMHCLVFFLSHAYLSNTYITDQKGLMPIAALTTLECCFLHMCYLLEEYEIICSWSRLNRFYQDFPGSATADFVQHTWQARGNLILTSNLFISFIVIATHVLSLVHWILEWGHWHGMHAPIRFRPLGCMFRLANVVCDRWCIISSESMEDYYISDHRRDTFAGAFLCQTVGIELCEIIILISRSVKVALVFSLSKIKGLMLDWAHDTQLSVFASWWVTRNFIRPKSSKPMTVICL